MRGGLAIGGGGRPASLSRLSPSSAPSPASSSRVSSAAVADRNDSNGSDIGASRRALAAAATAAAAALVLAAPWSSPSAALAAAVPAETPTARVALDFGIADRAVKAAADRTLGDRSILPLDDAAAHPAGRIVVALYGDRAPASARNLVAAVRGGFLEGTSVSRIVPGEYVQLGRQGARRQGELDFPPGTLAPNPDASSAAALRVGAGDRPGTVALSLGENDEDPGVRAKAGYVPFEFLITTGPGPAPRLNDTNVAFGRVESGYDVLAAIAQTPTFELDARGKQLNRFASFIGDDRADKVARRYGRPLRAVVVLRAEVLEDSAGGERAAQ